MKKLLIASTALVMVAGAAHAEFKMTGDARFGLSYANDGSANETTAEARVRAKFNFSGTTDSGMGFGAYFLLNGKTGLTDDFIVYVSDSWGKVTVGLVDAGSDSVGLGIADIGYKGMDVDDVAESLYAESTNNVSYTGSFGAVSVALSAYIANSSAASADEGDWSLGVGYEGDGFYVAMGYDVDDSASTEVLSLGGGVKMGAVSANMIYSFGDGTADAYGLDFNYKLNSATTLTFAYADDGADDAYGLGVAYSLGGGATLKAGIGNVQGTTEAEVGMTFTF
ncbi:porin [Phaeovulum sp.]|uniref:porin n=1 Tax=Phaeovulum sp. TaxID=2934796 RepID=UPI003562D28C